MSCFIAPLCLIYEQHFVRGVDLCAWELTEQLCVLSGVRWSPSTPSPPRSVHQCTGMLVPGTGFTQGSRGDVHAVRMCWVA